MNKVIIFLSVYVSLLLISSGFSCGGGSGTTVQPIVTITAVDCPADSIQINATAKRNNATNNWIVTLNVNVKCNGRNIPNAEIKVTYLSTDYKITTDAGGDVSKRFPPATADPAGNSMSVTVKGAGDSEVKRDITVTAN